MWRRALIVGVAALAVVGLALVPTHTKQGVDFTVTTYTLPLYEKALDFVQRDLSYMRLTDRIVDAGQPPDARAMAIFRWTRANVRDTPAGFPIVDDHVWHIIIRGSGVEDQKADVFTTLCMYGGVPAYFAYAGRPPVLVLSYVWLNGAWRVFDVQNGVAFRNRRGELASTQDLASDPSLVPASFARAGLTMPDAYAVHFAGYRPQVAPEVLRPELQMVWPRLSHRLLRVVGLGRRPWQ